ncbi:hypothetical protein [Streptomyces purpurogeneiscleroticus]|uniref:hypothetical protein n=1 Tax=Streptomyces purpurogeneiscleroticus TaxID=68259 RepID=UPI001CBCCCAA|nr:hypothetical protein [Streptomyces purpurogeneiscleroticus]MBZ4016256.1 hypothetical protein [Streptomyces purpurogeneiscleroticus]
MDAGLAAVLGTTVGAIGTPATGATAALLSRSTARDQVRTETLRALREARRATYAGFAETAGRYVDMLATTLIPLERVDRFPEQREAWIENAHKHWKKALRFRQDEFQQGRILLYLDAAPPVAGGVLGTTAQTVFNNDDRPWNFYYGANCENFAYALAEGEHNPTDKVFSWK